MPEPWDRLPVETDAAYNAFRAYLTLGTGRTLDAAYRSHKGGGGKAGEGAGKAPGSWGTWSRHNRWVDRAKSYDDRGHKIADAAREKVIAQDAAAQTREQIRSARRRQQEETEWELAQLLIAKAKEMLATKLFASRATTADGKNIEVKPARWDLADAARFLEIAVKMARMSARLPLEIEEDQAADTAANFYATSGQLADDLPQGVVPDMPAETHVRPQIDVGKPEAGKNGNPIQPAKPRPKQGRP